MVDFDCVLDGEFVVVCPGVTKIGVGFDGLVDKDVLRGGGKRLGVTVRGGFGDYPFCGGGHGEDFGVLFVENCAGDREWPEM